MKKKTKIGKIGKKLLNNWAIKLFSLIAAFLLWLMVMTIDDPEDEKVFYNIPVRLVNTEVIADEDLVYEILDRTDTVSRVYVTAAKSIRDELTTDDIIAEADFQNLTVANTVEIRFYSQRYNEQISDISGSTEILKLNIEDRRTKRLTLEVTTTGDVAEGYIINDVSLDQNRIDISGAESVINSIVSARVTVDVTDSTSNISTYSDVKLYDADGNEVSANNVEMNAESVRVGLEILATKTVPVWYSVSGVPASGYMFTGVIESLPDSVLIAGTEETLASISALTVPEEALNITGQTEDMTSIVNLSDYLPDGVIFADSSFKGRATVTVYIEELVTRELHVSANRIQITGVPAGYTAELTEGGVYTVSVSGLGALIQPLSASSLQATVDISAYMEQHDLDTLTDGIYALEAAIAFDDGVTIVQPLTVHVTITTTETEQN